MITLRNITLSRGGRPLLEDVTLTFHAGQKIGVTGANGSGKSSLFALLLGQLHAERGDVDVPARLTIAHVAQETPALEMPALAFVLEGDAEIARLEREMGEAERAGDGARLATLHHDYEARDGWRARSRAATILHGLGFSGADQARAVCEFSGGWRVRLNVARALMCPSDLLLLDEPTNHLDLDAVIWLEDWLRAYPGTLLLISHDRDFLDNVVGHIVHIEHRRATLYTGNYAQFERTRAERLAQQQAAHDRQQREMAHIRSYVERFRAKTTKARQAQSRLKALARMELIAAAEADSPFTFTIPAPERCPDPLLVLKHAATGYDGKTVVSGVNLTIAPGTRLGILGRNGAGKSTLLRLIAGESPCLAGERVAAKYLACGYFVQHQLEKLRATESPLEHLLRLEPQTREQDLRDFIGGFGFSGDDVKRTIETFSGGERTRLALALLVRQRPNLLVLDEPTNHLDLLMRDALTRALQDYPGALIVVSHDRYLLRAVTDEFLLVANGAAQPFAGDLDDYRAWLAQTDTEAGSDVSARPEHGAPARKERKRIAAERRNALHRERKPLEQRMKKVEAELERLHAEQRAIQGEIADPGLYGAENKARLQDVLRREAAVKSRLAEVEAEWLDLGERIEALG